MNKSTKVYELMSKYIIVGDKNHTFSQVCQLFLEKKLHHLPIVDENDKLIGIISSYDVLHTYKYGMPIYQNNLNEHLDETVELEQIMTANPITILPTDTIGDAAILFVRYGIHALPVVEDGRILCIITNNDLIQHFAANG